MRYWLSNGDGQTYGPYTLEELQRYAAEGRVSPATQLCEEGSTSWQPATAVLGVGLRGVPPTTPGPSGGPVPPTTAGAYGTPAASWQPVSVVWPILSILCCCMPAGIVSLVYATNANTKAAQGNLEGAEADRKKSNMWLRIGVLAGVVVAIFSIVLNGFMAMSQR